MKRVAEGSRWRSARQKFRAELASFAYPSAAAKYLPLANRL